nr:uncharacterized protein LOC112003444 [Quercus suber]
MEDATVDCLIDNNTGNWDAEMLKGVLIPAKAELALRIPLPRSQTEDVLFWPFTADGQYNCKSGYKFLKGLEENSDVGTHTEVDRKFWKKMWNSLPTEQNLVRRTIIQTSNCDRCFLQAEDSLHALWSCTGLNEVWDGDSWSFRSNIQFTDFKELCSWILENGKPMELFAVQVWSIWNQRNKLRLNQSCCLTKDLQKMAVESWNEICRSNLRLNWFSSSPTHHIVWTAPAPDSYKIN